MDCLGGTAWKGMKTEGQEKIWLKPIVSNIIFLTYEITRAVGVTNPELWMKTKICT